MLPDGLPDDWRVTPLGPDDTEAAFGLVEADRTRFLGFNPLTRDTVASTLEPRGARRLVLGVWAADRLEQVWQADLEPGTDTVIAVVNRRADSAAGPEVPGGLVDRLYDAGFATMATWARGVVADPAHSDLRTMRLLPDAFGRAAIERQGFVQQRTFWMMEGPVPPVGATSAHPPPVGLTVQAVADPAAVHRIITDGFRDHWGYDEQSLDDFLEDRRGMPGFRPDWWFTAHIADEAVGAMTLTDSSASQGVLHVSELAVRADRRRRGVATALLTAAFDLARRQGLTTMRLFADSESSSGAPRLYRDLGLEVRSASAQYERPLGAG